jgi:chromosome partitioning protein
MPASAASPITAAARESLDQLKAPLWSGQITHRTTYSLALAEGEGAREFDPDSLAATEIARLFSAIERSVAAIVGKGSATNAMHRRAA